MLVFSSSAVRASICAEFSSKNVMLNFLMFSGGIGFSILVGGVFVEGGGSGYKYVVWDM